MKVILSKWLPGLFVLFFPAVLFSQNKTIDSLKAQLSTYNTVKNFEADTNYLNTLNELAFRYTNINPDTSIAVAARTEVLCNKINYQTGTAEALKNSGLAHNMKGEYDLALDFLNRALVAAKASGYIRGVGKIYHNTGIVYSNLGKYPESLENHFKALKIRDSIGDKLGIASSVNAIGAVYFSQGKLNDALKNYQTALKNSKEINYTAGVESAYGNIGEVYFRQGKFTEAQENLFKSLEITKETGNKESIAFLNMLIGAIYYQQQKFPEATEAYLKSNRVAAEVGSKEYVGRSYLGLGQVYLALHNPGKALEYTELGMQTAKQIGYNEILRDGNEILSKIYETRGDGMQALYYHKQFKLYADSINNQQTDLKTSNISADYEYSKKEIVLKAEQDKKDLEFQKKTNQQRWLIFSAFAALFSALVVSLLIYRSRQKEKKNNQLLQRKNTEIDQQKNNAEKALADLKTAQTQLIQSEKMASLGELTAGIAHEIQNPLNFVNNFSEVNIELLEEMNEEIAKGNYDDAKTLAGDITKNEEKINHHGKRADAIVKGMLQHSRSSIGVKEATNINALADEYLRLAYHGLRAKENSFNATLNTNYDESIGKINVISLDMGRVILNLITNAFYTLKEKKKMADAAGISYEPTVWVSTLKTGNGISISVKDNGNGIPQKILDKIFQPFFTTKPTGQGTGLGLSLSYDIVKAHGGEIKVNTKENEGTEFIIQLPV